MTWGSEKARCNRIHRRETSGSSSTFSIHGPVLSYLFCIVPLGEKKYQKFHLLNRFWQLKKHLCPNNLIAIWKHSTHKLKEKAFYFSPKVLQLFTSRMGTLMEVGHCTTSQTMGLDWTFSFLFLFYVNILYGSLKNFCFYHSNPGKPENPWKTTMTQKKCNMI